MVLHPRFYRTDRSEARARVRRELGVPDDAFTLMLLFGGKGSPEMEPLAARLREVGAGVARDRDLRRQPGAPGEARSARRHGGRPAPSRGLHRPRGRLHGRERPAHHQAGAGLPGRGLPPGRAGGGHPQPRHDSRRSASTPASWRSTDSAWWSATGRRSRTRWPASPAIPRAGRGCGPRSWPCRRTARSTRRWTSSARGLGPRHGVIRSMIRRDADGDWRRRPEHAMDTAKLLYRRLDSLFGALDPSQTQSEQLESFLEDAFTHPARRPAAEGRPPLLRAAGRLRARQDRGRRRRQDRGVARPGPAPAGRRSSGTASTSSAIPTAEIAPYRLGLFPVAAAAALVVGRRPVPPRASSSCSPRAG